MTTSGYAALREKYGIGKQSAATATVETKPAQDKTFTAQQPIIPATANSAVSDKVTAPTSAYTYKKPEPQPQPVKPQLPSQLKLFKKLKEDAEFDDETEFLENLLEKIKLLNESDAKAMMRDSFSDDGDGDFSFNYNGYNFSIHYDPDENTYKVTMSHDDLSEEVEQEFEYEPNSEVPSFFKVLEQKYLDSFSDESKKDYEILQNVGRNLGTKIRHYYSESIDYDENNGEYYLKTESKVNKYICVKDNDDNANPTEWTFMSLSFTNIDPAKSGFDIDDDAHHTIEINNYEIPYWRIAKKVIDYVDKEYDKDRDASKKANEQLREVFNKPADVRQKIVLDGMRQM